MLGNSRALPQENGRPTRAEVGPAAGNNSGLPPVKGGVEKEVPMRRLAVLLLVTLSCDAASDPERALFRRAYDLSVAGREEEALALYRQILRADGGTRYQPDAHVAL